MQSQGVVQAVGLFQGNRDPRDTEAHPVLAARIDDEHLTIERQNAVEAGVGASRHGQRLSH